MKIIIIGGGIISNKLVSMAPSHFNIFQLGIRDFSESNKSWDELLQQCQDADFIVYLAYHHRDLIKNLRLIAKLLSSLSSTKWIGKLIFFNTQSTLVKSVFKTKRFSIARKFPSFDLYTVTKFFQSLILSIFSRKIPISEIYLPVVLGAETKAQRRFEFISGHKQIFLPNKGNNLFAYIELNEFINWFWMQYLDELSNPVNSREFRKVFVYQGLRTFSEMIDLIRSNLIDVKKVISGEVDSLVVEDCLYKYRFSDDPTSNFLHHLKITPIWLALSIFRNEIKKLTSSKWKAPEEIDCIAPVDATFSPKGPEYEYLSTSIDMAAIPFNIVKLHQ